MRINIFGEDLTLLVDKAIYWESAKILMIADLHMGKINHFRKAGIPVPLKANESNIESLLLIIQRTKPLRVIFLGDLFHSHYNQEWEQLRELIKSFPEITFELVVGNHDILSTIQYERSNIRMHFETLDISPFVLSHHPLENIAEAMYNLSGHIHPGIQLLGKGKQAMTLPCFYFGAQQGILPAFGSFTGLARLRPKKNDQIYVIADNTIIKV